MLAYFKLAVGYYPNLCEQGTNFIRGNSSMKVFLDEPSVYHEKPQSVCQVEVGQLRNPNTSSLYDAVSSNERNNTLKFHIAKVNVTNSKLDRQE